MLAPSDPSKVMVIRQVTPNITTLSLPFARFGIFKVGGRGSIGMEILGRGVLGCFGVGACFLLLLLLGLWFQ